MWTIFNLLSWISQWFWKLWSRFPEKAKREIIEAIIQAMGEMLRAYYRDRNSKGGK